MGFEPSYEVQVRSSTRVTETLNTAMCSVHPYMVLTIEEWKHVLASFLDSGVPDHARIRLEHGVVYAEWKVST